MAGGGRRWRMVGGERRRYSELLNVSSAGAIVRIVTVVVDHGQVLCWVCMIDSRSS